jgi:putative transposase
MPRLARIAVANMPHHITQRGNARQFLLAAESEKAVYFELLSENLALYEVSLLGYCLMSNHVHLIMIPAKADSLALTMKQTHGRYAAFWNATHRSSGHVWQGRFYSCPLDESHLWMALRYVERNPVRAGLTSQAQDWPWSSAAAHCGVSETSCWLAMERFRQRWPANAWCAYLDEGETAEQLRELRRCTHTGRPLGGKAFIQELEGITKRSLVPSKGGRPRRNLPDPSQAGLDFGNAE